MDAAGENQDMDGDLCQNFNHPTVTNVTVVMRVGFWYAVLSHLEACRACMPSWLAEVAANRVRVGQYVCLWLAALSAVWQPLRLEK